jgi:hypothetical protein
VTLDFGEVLATAWKTVWKRKVLFAFGLLPMTISVLIGIVMGSAFIFLGPELASSGADPFEQFFKPGPRAEIAVMAFVALLILISVLSFVLTMFFMMIPFGLGLITAGLGSLCILPLMCLMVPVAFFFGIMLNLCISSIVVDGMSLTGAIAHSWNVVLENIWPLVLMGLLLYVIQWLISMLASAPFSFVQFGFTGFMTAQTDPFEILNFIGILMMISTPIMAFVQGLGYTYTQSAWTLSYIRLTRKADLPENSILAEPNA